MNKITKDIEALVVNMRGRAITRINNGGYAEISVKATELVLILDQLEAERQRRDAAEKDSGELEQSLNVANAATQAWKQRANAAEASVGVLEGTIARKEFDALKGEQVPVSNPVLAYADSYRAMARRGSDFVPIWGVITDLERNIAPLFTAQQSPVISKEKLCDWLEDNFDIDDSQRDAFANCFAHHCNCIVKGGE